MKIKYTFVTGETTEVEVDEAIGTFILGSRREEENKDRYKRKHSYSLDAIPFEDISLASLNTPENSIVVNEEAEDFNKKLKTAMSELSETQKRRLRLYLSGMSIREIARREGVNHSAVAKSFQYIRDVFEKIFKNN